MSAAKKYEVCGARNAWGNVCTKKAGHTSRPAVRHGDGEYEWPTEAENEAIRDWFAAEKS